MNRSPAASGVVSPAMGAHVTSSGVSYSVWAPDHTAMQVRVQKDGSSYGVPLQSDQGGSWLAFDPDGRAGDLYQFEFSDGRRRPDPASRFQPQGVHGPSECIDSGHYPWRCTSWKRPGWTGQTIYEIHLGTLTDTGTFRAAIAKLDHVRDLGVEAIELMPVADFAGDRNWGYDGVAWYAPARCYGRPDDLRALVDAAHERGLAVILDVVYNHLGPAGNYLAEFCADYFHPDQPTPWGSALNVDGARSRPLRDLIIGNAAYWLDEFRFDGLRLDATHAIPDHSARHLLEEIAETVHERGGFLVAEDERNDAKIVHGPDGQGLGLDALWADDFHHQVRVALTDTRDSYFRAYRGKAVDIADTLAHGWSYRGRPYEPWAGRSRGTECDHLSTQSFITCIENHDQIGNRANGERLEHLVSARQFRAASMLLCLSPYVPMIFMGQEWAASTPFLFFTDHGGELGSQISVGRQGEFAQHGTHWSAANFPDPEAITTFTRSKLLWPELSEPNHATTLALYRESLLQRKTWFRAAALERGHWQVEAVGEIIAIRYQAGGEVRLLLVALREDNFLEENLSSLINPPVGHHWQTVLHSEEKRFGGEEGTRTGDDWKIAGPAAIWLNAVKEETTHAAP